MTFPEEWGEFPNILGRTSSSIQKTWDFPWGMFLQKITWDIASQVMGEKAETLGLVAFETLPWACRFNDWGKTATVLGTKDIF